MKMTVSISCPECGKTTNVPIKPNNEEKYYLSDSIEQKQEGFYCSLNWQDAMKINCFCGNSIKLHY